MPRPRAGSATAARILLACADEEQHSLPLEALAAALAEAGVSCRLLGARVPAGRAASTRSTGTGPAAVVVWAHVPATGRPRPVHALLSGTPSPVLVLAAGPGWRADTLPAGVDSAGQPRRGGLAMTSP